MNSSIISFPIIILVNQPPIIQYYSEWTTMHYVQRNVPPIHHTPRHPTTTTWSPSASILNLTPQKTNSKHLFCYCVNIWVWHHLEKNGLPKYNIYKINGFSKLHVLMCDGYAISDAGVAISTAKWGFKTWFVGVEWSFDYCMWYGYGIILKINGVYQSGV